jgi:hypothetical protein
MPGELLRVLGFAADSGSFIHEGLTSAFDKESDVNCVDPAEDLV